MKKINRNLLLTTLVLSGFLGHGQEYVHDEKDYVRPFLYAIDSILTVKKDLNPLLSLAIEDLPSDPVAVHLKRINKKDITASEVYRNAKEASVVIGSAYLNTVTDKASINEASGYVIDAKGIVVTNYHVINAYLNMAKTNKQLGLFVRLSDGRTYPVKQIVCAKHEYDLALLELEVPHETKLPTLPLEKNAAIGDLVYALGNANGMHYFFSQGIVTYKKKEDIYNGNKKKFERDLMLISADYAVGSSGGPILDARGNVVGTVSSTNSVYVNNDPRRMQMVIKSTIPVKSLWNIIEEVK